MSLMDYLASMLKAMAQRKLMKPRQTGPGEYKTPRVGTNPLFVPRHVDRLRGRYDEQGKIVPVKAIVGDDDHAVIVPAERTVAELGAWTPTVEGQMVHEQGAYAAAVELHGSQRKAAAALGMTRAAFRRALKKAQS